MKSKSLLTLLIIFLAAVSLDGESAGDVVKQFGRFLETVTDYQCRMYEWSIKGRKKEIRYINFYFRKPRLIRMDIIDGNRNGDPGSIAVLLPDGRVRGRKGGILSPFAITVDKDSAPATTIRGVTFDESDALAALDRLHFLLDHSTVRFSTDPGGWLFDCLLDKPEQEITREILYLSSTTMMPVYTKSMEGDKLVQHVEWSSYIINGGLPEEFFNVRYEAEGLKELQIPNNLDLPLEKKE